MTSRIDADANAPSDEMGDILSQVRQLDPTSEEVAVRSYLREMADADAVLNTVDLDVAPLSVSFSPSWPEGLVR
jgi:hypothetical protein